MAKRRRKKPNIPKAALEHARQEAEIDESNGSTDEAVPTSQEEKTVQTATEDKPKPRRRRRDLQTAKLDKRKAEGALDAEYVAELLENPTKVVTEEELRQDYAYVLRDLRSMGILAAVLFIALIGIALVVL